MPAAPDRRAGFPAPAAVALGSNVGDRLANLERAVRRLERLGRLSALSPVYEEALVFTGFALDEFKARAERDGTALAVLATHHLEQPGDRIFDRLHDLAAARGIPVISQRAWIERRGGDVRDARWTHDMHWSPTGHRWAAEALLEWIARNRHVCGAEDGPGIDEPPARG